MSVRAFDIPFHFVGSHSHTLLFMASLWLLALLALLDIRFRAVAFCLAFRNFNTSIIAYLPSTNSLLHTPLPTPTPIAPPLRPTHLNPTAVAAAFQLWTPHHIMGTHNFAGEICCCAASAVPGSCFKCWSRAYWLSCRISFFPFILICDSTIGFPAICQRPARVQLTRAFGHAISSGVQRPSG